MNKDFFRTRGNPKTLCAVLLVLLMPVFFFTCVSVTSYGGGVSLASWIKSTWTVETEYEHGWAVPALFLVFVWLKRKEMSHEAVAKSSWCLLLVCIGLLCYVATVRTLQMRLAFFGLPFLIVGGTGYACFVSGLFLVFCDYVARAAAGDKCFADCGDEVVLPCGHGYGDGVGEFRDGN